MSRAIKLASRSLKLNEVPVGCVVVKDDNIIIGKGFNTRNKKQNAILHAEIIAIDKACKKLNSWRLEDCSIYTTLEPCAMCAGAILQARIKKLIYGAKNKKFGCAGSVMNFLEDNKFNHKVKILSGINKSECENIIKKFFIDLRINNKKQKTKINNKKTKNKN
jgi:tRNA(adenine34) deaminase